MSLPSSSQRFRVFATSWLAILTIRFNATAGLVINEIHYHPVEKAAFGIDGEPSLDLSSDVHEFLEIHNPDPINQPLDGWRIEGGINFVFPSNASISPRGFLVVAKNPAALAAVYKLDSASVVGPWKGQLGNEGDSIRLVDDQGGLADDVTYSSSPPWPTAANALGADDEWTGLLSLAYQYTGRSLERVSASHPSNDPANWLASPLGSRPSPGSTNHFTASHPKPVVASHIARSSRPGHDLIRSNHPIVIECAYTSAENLSRVQLEWFVDDINAANEPRNVVFMDSMDHGSSQRFGSEIPALPGRSILRYRFLADRGEGSEIVSPRPTEPFGWHSAFVTPERNSTNRIYDAFISRRSLTILSTNINGSPRRTTLPDPPGRLRPSWNATQPAVFVHNGIVYDIQFRHHGSQFRRDVGRKSYKMQFPAYSRFEGLESVFITDKDYRTANGHAIFREAGLPTSSTRLTDWYFNTDARIVRLEQSEYDNDLLTRFHLSQQQLHPGSALENNGELYKSQGIIGPGGASGEGPYGPGSGVLLLARTNRVNRQVYYTPRQRYEATFTLQNHGWHSHREFEDLINGMWSARKFRDRIPTNANADLALLQSWVTNHWNLSRVLPHVALVNWMGFWDDTLHNFFLWHQSDGRWSLLPWDFDEVMDGRTTTGNIFIGEPFAGPNFFKDSVVAAFRDDFRQTAWKLNATLLDPNHLASMGIDRRIVTWARTRQNNINTQLRLGRYSQPLTPRPRSTNLVYIGPYGSLTTEPYAHTTNSRPAHATTRWIVRTDPGLWNNPVFVAESSEFLESLPLPHDVLTPNGTYAWRATFTDADGHESVPGVVGRFHYGTGEPTNRIRITEVLAENQAALTHRGRFPDYVILHNPTEDPIDLGAVGFTDDLLRPFKFVFPSGTTLAAGANVRVWCDSLQVAGEHHSGFALRRTGEHLYLFDVSQDPPAALHNISFGPQAADLAIRWQSNRWELATPSATPTALPVDPGDPATLRINEWSVRPESGPGWIELYNPSPQPIHLSGLGISHPAMATDTFLFPPLSYIGPKSFLRLVADADPEDGRDHLPFRLASHGGWLGLVHTNQSRIDQVLMAPTPPSGSAGRIPDGGGWVAGFDVPSPAQSNGGDLDNDEIPDRWQGKFGLSSGSSEQDPDNDGWSNLEEYRLGTVPTNSSSRFALSASFAPSGKLRIRFPVGTSHSYRIESMGASEDSWRTEDRIARATFAHDVVRELPVADTSRLFRVVAE